MMETSIVLGHRSKIRVVYVKKSNTKKHRIIIAGIAILAGVAVTVSAMAFFSALSIGHG